MVVNRKGGRRDTGANCKERLRVREEINLYFQESRRTHGKTRGGRIASYLTDEQRSQAEWIGASKCEVIFERALSPHLHMVAIMLLSSEEKKGKKEEDKNYGWFLGSHSGCFCARPQGMFVFLAITYHPRCKSDTGANIYDQASECS